jgi:hypothetical protein
MPLDLERFVVMCRQGVPICHEEKTLVFLLKLEPVLEHTMVVAEMERAGGPHT